MQIENVWLSCESDSYEPGKGYCWFIVYTMGSFPAKAMTGRNIHPGYVVFLEKSKLEACKKNNPQCCGKHASYTGMTHG